MIHLYWHTEPNRELKARADAWRELNNTEVRIWTPRDLPDITARTKASMEFVYAPDHVRHLANTARWALLDAYGGTWVDTDVTPHQPFGDFLHRTQPWCASIQGMPTPFVCGGPSDHPLWQRMTGECLGRPHGTSPEASGGRLLRRVAQPNELVHVPAALFASRDAGGNQLVALEGGRLSDHDWATSRRRRAGIMQ